MTQPPPPPGWYPDPAGSGGTRWWNGQGWTEHVQAPPVPPPPPPAPAPVPTPPQVPAAPEPPAETPPAQPPAAATQLVTLPPAPPPRPPVPPAPTPQQEQAPAHHQDQAHQHDAVRQEHAPGQHHQQQWTGPSLYEQSVLVVSQKTKLIELTNEYAVYDGQGQQIGAVVQVGQSTAKKVLRFVSNLDQFLTHRLEVRDARGVVLVLTRPAKLVKSRIVVTRADGSPVGEIVQANVFGKIRFDLVANGQLVGAIQAENWRAWNFAITDTAGTEVARITKTWEGLTKTLFTAADNYVVHVHYRLPEPLASMVIASALTVDTALKQDDRGFN